MSYEGKVFFLSSRRLIAEERSALIVHEHRKQSANEEIKKKTKPCRKATSWVLKLRKKAQKVDALAVEGEERRGSLRKASGSWQTNIDPEISEWGNPPVTLKVFP